MVGELGSQHVARTVLVLVLVGIVGMAGVPVAFAQSQAASPSDSAAECKALRGATFADVMQGKVPGVNVMRSAGASSGAATVRVRGVHTLQSNTPVVYIDGIRIAQLSSSRLFSVPLLEFVDPIQVESIEVIKGPEASFRYGNEASSGVILIHTRRSGKRSAHPAVGCR